MRRTTTALAAAALAAAVLTGCGGSSSGDNETLVYWATQQSGSIATDRKLLTTELGRFTRQTGIHVRLEIPTWPSLYGKILTAVAGGDGPDVLNIGNTWSAALQHTGAFLPFDREAMQQVGGSGHFVASALASTGAAGRTPASVPLYGEVYALFYNKAMFRAAGITAPPATWAQFVADAKRLTASGRYGVALPAGTGSGSNVHLAFILGRQHGARLFDAADKPQLASPAEQAAVHELVDLLATDRVVDPSGTEQNGLEAQDELAKGKAAMTFAQSGATAYFAALGFSGYGVAPVPTVHPLPPGGAAVRSMVGGTNVSILKHTAHRAASLRLVKFLTSDSEQVRLNKAYGSLPVVRGAYTDKAFRGPAMSVFGATLAQHAEPMPMVAQEGKMETVLGDAVARLWAKAARGPVSRADVAAALRAANEKLTPR